MLYNGQKVKPKTGDLCRWNDEDSTWFGFITNVWKNAENIEHVLFHFGDGSKKTLCSHQCRHFKIVARS